MFGGLQQQIGARASCLIGAAGIGSGFALMGLACEMHSIPLLLTAAAIQGLGNGFAYVPPVAALVSWFPDRKGLASGTAIGESFLQPFFHGHDMMHCSHTSQSHPLFS